MSLYLAVDAGGTKTEFLLADDTRELARTRTGTIKRMRTDADSADRNLEAALAGLTSYAGVSMRQVTRTCVGAAGSEVPLVAEWMRQAFAQRVGGDMLLLGDVEIALDGAFQGGPGVLVLAGTGSNVAGRTDAGEVTRAGGWGPALADQGSGHRIGLQALRDIVLALDEEKETMLHGAVMRHWGLNDLNLFVEHANRIPAPDFSQLAPLVAFCAEHGDAVAQRVLRREAEELAYLVKLVIGRLGRKAARQDWVPHIAFAGSIVEHILPIREGIVDALRQQFPELRVRPGIVDPLHGALWRARTGW